MREISQSGIRYEDKKFELVILGTEKSVEGFKGWRSDRMKIIYQLGLVDAMTFRLLERGQLQCFDGCIHFKGSVCHSEMVEYILHLTAYEFCPPFPPPPLPPIMAVWS